MVDITDPIFHDEEKARAYFEAGRWADGVTCPLCGSIQDISPLAGNSMGPGWYHCNACREKFTVRVGTVMERSHIPLHKWALAFRLMVASKKGVSAKQLERMLGLTYRTAWFMAHRIRLAMSPNAKTGPLGGAGKVIKSDETFVAARRRTSQLVEQTLKSDGQSSE